MNVLIVTNYRGSGPYIPEFREMLIREGISVDILDLDGPGVLAASDMSATPLAKSLLPLLRNPLIRPFVLVPVLKYSLRRFGKKYDLINVHFVNPVLIFLIKELRFLANKIVVSVWGSDFYRVGVYTRMLERILYNNADAITFINPKTREDFINFFMQYADKTHIVRFGIGNMKRIQRIMLTEPSCTSREKLGLLPGRLLIMCGYNATPAQQHEKIIDMLKSMRSSLPDNIFIVFPMTYPHHPEYVKKIERMMAGSGYAFKVFDKLLTGDDMARLRRSADIVINIQTTDQLSASIQEHLYAGNVVLTGKWLPYDIYDEMGLFFFRAQDLTALKAQLIESAGRLPEYQEKCKRNGSLIEQFSSWEVNILYWKRLYRELTSA